MRNKTQYRTLLLLMLALILLFTASCTSAGNAESDPEQFPGENTSGDTSLPEETSSAESSKSAVSILPESGTEENPPEESPAEESNPEESAPLEPLPEESAPDDPTDPPVEEVFGDTFNYVALGDSICRGYGLADPETQRYSSLIAERTGCAVHNYGVDGQTGSGLLTFLQEGKAEALPQADVVSVSIGANNLLTTLSTLLRALFSDIVTSDPEPSADAESFYAAVDEALASFEQELPELIGEIRGQAPNAHILFQTVYNPYRSFAHFPIRLNGSKVYLAELADGCVTRLNDMIRAGAQTYGYTVCDVYDAFEQNADQLVNASLSKLNFDPHPNAAGHKVIADTLLKEIPKSS